MLLALMTTGCQTPVRRDPGLLEQDRRQVTEALEPLAAALRNKNPAGLRQVMLPNLPSERVVTLATRLAQASWLPRYSGYSLQEPPLGNVDERGLAEGLVEVEVLGVNDMGRRLTDTVHLVRKQQTWWIRDFELQQPEPGDTVQPPPEMTAGLREKVLPLMQNLREGHVWYIWGELPKTGSGRYRLQKKKGFLGLFSGKEAVPLHQDLQIVRRLDFTGWPDPIEDMDLVYLGPGAMAAAYDVPYAWGTGPEPDLLHVEFTFVHQIDGWQFQRVDFRGKAIPK